MKLTQGFFLAAAALLAGSVFFSCGQPGDSAPVARRTVVFATDATWPPMEFKDVSGQPAGFDIDMVRAMGAIGGFDVQFRIEEWGSIFTGLENGSYDAIVSCLTINDERKLKYDFTDSYLQAGQVLLVPFSDPEGESLAGMAGKKVGVQESTAGATVLDMHPEVDKVDYAELGPALQDLADGVIGGVICDLPVALDYSLQNESFAGKVKVSGGLLTTEDLGIAVRKGDRQTLELLNLALKTLNENGTLGRIKAAWGVW